MTQGSVSRLDVPFSAWMGHLYESGKSDSMLSAISNTTEDQLEHHTGPQMQPDELQKKYGVGDLKFTKPEYPDVAQAMSEREKNRMDQAIWINSGAPAHWYSPKFAAGMLASMAGATANPVDFGSMFIPFVGEGKKLEEAGLVARIMNRGLISQKAIEASGVPVPRLIGSMAQGTMWMGMAEVPKMYEAHIEGQSMPPIGRDLVTQALLAGVLHGVAEGLKRLDPRTHDAMSKQTVNDFLDDRDTNVHQYIPLDEHVIQYEAIERDRKLREEAANDPSVQARVEMSKRDLVKEQGELPLYAAMRNTATGEIKSAMSHMETGVDGAEGWERGFLTDKNRFVTEDQAADLAGVEKEAGYNHESLATDRKLHSETLRGTADPSLLTSDAEMSYFLQMKEMNMTDAEAMQRVYEHRQDIRAKRILARPDVQAEIERQRQNAISDWVDNKKRELANPVPQRTQQTARAETVPHADVEKYNGDHQHLDHAIEDDIHGLGGRTPEEQKLDREKDPIHNWLDNAIKSLESDPTKFHSDPLLLKTLGAPVLRSILIATREAYKVSKDLMQAIQQALAEHNLGDINFENKVKDINQKILSHREEMKNQIDKAPAPETMAVREFQKLAKSKGIDVTEDIANAAFHHDSAAHVFNPKFYEPAATELREVLGDDFEKLREQARKVIPAATIAFNKKLGQMHELNAKLDQDLQRFFGKNLNNDQLRVIHFAVDNGNIKTPHDLIRAIRDEVQTEIEMPGGFAIIQEGVDSYFKLDAEGQLVKNPDFHGEMSDSTLNFAANADKLIKILQQRAGVDTSRVEQQLFSALTKGDDFRLDAVKVPESIDEAVNCILEKIA